MSYDIIVRFPNKKMADEFCEQMCDGFGKDLCDFTPWLETGKNSYKLLTTSKISEDTTVWFVNDITKL